VPTNSLAEGGVQKLRMSGGRTQKEDALITSLPSGSKGKRESMKKESLYQFEKKGKRKGKGQNNSSSRGWKKGDARNGLKRRLGKKEKPQSHLKEFDQKKERGCPKTKPNIAEKRLQ